VPMISRQEFGRLKGAWHQARAQNLAANRHLSRPSFSAKPSFNVRPSWAPKVATRTLGSARRKWMAGRGKEEPRGKFEFSGDVRAGSGFGDPGTMFKSSYRGEGRFQPGERSVMSSSYRGSRPRDYSMAGLRRRFGLTGRARPAKATKHGDVVGPESRRRRAFEMLGGGGGV
jgi:hypothetical protein